MNFSNLRGFVELPLTLQNTGKFSDHCQTILLLLIMIKATNQCENGKMVIFLPFFGTFSHYYSEYNMRKEYGDENRLKELQSVKGTLILHQHLFALHDEQIRTTSDIVNKTFNTLMPKLYV